MRNEEQNHRHCGLDPQSPGRMRVKPTMMFARSQFALFILHSSLFILHSLFFLVSCNNKGIHEPTSAALGFTIENHGEITVLTVSNPWQGARNIEYRYALVPKGMETPEKYSQYTVIHTPVESVICLSSTHVAMLSALGQTASIVALSGTAFITDSTVREAINEGYIVDIGYEQSLNFEKIISLNPDVIFAYGVGDELVGSMARLADLGQKVVYIAEHLERTALSRAEWMKFVAAFFDIQKQATDKFDAIKDEYLALCSLVEGIEHKPVILCGLPWQGIWHVPGGKSWMAAMIADAGGDYIWKNNSSHEPIPVSIETIFNRGGSSDFWINTGAARSLAQIQAVDARLSNLKPFREGAVYNNNARTGANGGNDFFESSVVNPHKVLKDMIKIFHPDLLHGGELYYYVKLE